jgi:hypothetical protein
MRGATTGEIAPAYDLGAALAVHHRRSARALVRQQAADTYSLARHAAGFEAVDHPELLRQ